MDGKPRDHIPSANKQFNLESVVLKPEEALECLTGLSEVILPIQNVRACNNLDEYFVKSTMNSRKKHKPDDSSTVKRSKPFQSTFSKEPFAVPLVRNFEKILKKDENGEPIKGTYTIAKKVKSDVFSRIEQIEPKSGPLAILKKRMGKSTKVLIRRRRKVPYISRVIEYKGILVTFDKHMNLYLKDVIESFTYTVGSKTLKRARHRENLMIRGDNIILIH